LAICGTNHDPDMPCGDGAGQIMRGAGINKSRKMPKRESEKTERDFSRAMKIVFLIILLLILFLLYAALSRRGYYTFATIPKLESRRAVIQA
jgi:hypothetical protein